MRPNQQDALYRTAAFWFRLWMAAWILFGTGMLLSAPADRLLVSNVVPSVGLTALLLAVAAWISTRVSSGRLLGAATGFVGLFLIGSLVPLGILATGQMDHAQPVLIGGLIVGFAVVTLVTLVILVRALTLLDGAPRVR